MVRAAIALGSNISPRKEHLSNAVDHIASIENVRILARSRIYETDPEGGPERQGMFLNAALVLDTGLPARELLRRLLDIERSLGRVRTVRNGPRNIDLDIIFFEDLLLNDLDLILPHPRFRDRGFVLLPLNDVMPDHRDPCTKKTVAELLDDWRRKDGRTFTVRGTL